MSGAAFSAHRGAVVGAILLGLFWSVAGIDQSAPQLERMILLAAGLVLLGLAIAGRGGAAPVAGYALAIAAAERLGRTPFDGSDVLAATTEAIQVFLRGGNPYAHLMQSTFPVGSPFVYPPGEFLFYLPTYLISYDITRVDTVTGILSVGLIVLAGLRVGWERVALPAMLYATWGIGSYRAVDGSNDVSASFLVIAALVALAFADPRSRAGRIAFVLSAIALGWAVAFKQFAVVIAPLVVRHLAVTGRDWRRYAAVSAGTAAAFIIPFLLWDPGAFLSQQVEAVTFHKELWGINLPNLVAQFEDVEPLYPLFFAGEVLLSVLGFAFALRSRLGTIGLAAFAGCGVILTALLFARWSSQPYFIYLGAIACAALALVDRSAEASENLESAR